MPDETVAWLGVLDILDTGVILLDPQGSLQFANRAAVDLTGDPVAFACGVAREGGVEEVERTSDDGVHRILRVKRHRLGAGSAAEVLLVSDVSHERRHAEALERIDRLDEALRLLSVISHKINNPLTALLGRAQILKSRASGGDPHVEKASQVIEESASRVADLARDLSRLLKESRQESVDQVLAAEAVNRG